MASGVVGKSRSGGGTSRIVSRGAVQIRGLTEFQRALRDIDATLPKELRQANKNAAEVVAEAGRARAESLGGVARKAAPSLRAAAEQRYAKVSLGGARYPFALGANFGAQHDVPRVSGAAADGTVLGWNQFPEWGGNQFTGGAGDRFLYWALRARRDEFVAEYERQIDLLLDKLGGLPG